MAIIRSAWSRTDFAKPQVSMQPVGNKTLVTLPVFFRITWPEAGFEPGEVNTVNLLGYTVRIRPTFQANQYHYGDGQASGSTKSFGGVYPSGDIRHEYSKKGSYAVHASTRYGGEFAVEGGGWMTLPGTTSVAGPQEQLQVVTAKNRLVQ